MTVAWYSSGSTNWMRRVRTSIKLTALAAHHAGKLYLPPGYSIRLDADLLTLHRDEGSMVTSFVVGASPSEVVREAEEDYRARREAAS
jgi:hypothetical protein